MHGVDIHIREQAEPDGHGAQCHDSTENENENHQGQVTALQAGSDVPVVELPQSVERWRPGRLVTVRHVSEMARQQKKTLKQGS